METQRQGRDAHPTKGKAWLGLALVLALGAPFARGQMMLSQASPTPVNEEGKPDPLQPLRAISLLMVEPPKPRTYAIHDKVTIIISETSRQSSNQTLDTKKDATFKAALNKFPDLAALLEARLENGESSPIVSADVTHSNKWKGEGKYDRTDQYTDRVTATIIDVKPNGVIVIEARRTIQKDEEIQTVVLSGQCRREDITTQNTVMSNQLAELTLISRNEGQVKKASEKGLIPRFFEAIFNF